MFSIVERATTRAFARILVIVLAAALLCGAYPVVLMAREADKTPCEMPGDADGIGGYKNFEFEGASTGFSDQPSIPPTQRYKQTGTLEVYAHQMLLVLQLYLVTRR